MKVAFLVKELSGLRGAPLLLFNFASALRYYYDIHTLVADIENTKSLASSNFARLLQENNRYISYMTQMDQCTFYNVIPHAVKHSIYCKCCRPLDFSALTLTLYRSTVAHPKEISSLLTTLAKHFDIIHTGLWKDQLLYSTYIMKRKKLFSDRVKLVIHPLIHPSPFITSPQLKRASLIRYIADKIGYKSLIHMLQSFDGITVSTPYEFSLLRSYDLNNVWFVGEGVDHQWIEKNIDIINQKAEEVRENTKSENIITFIGFRHKYKGYCDFLKAILILLKEKNVMNQQKLRILVLGRLPEKTKLTEDEIECRLIEKKFIQNGLMIAHNSLPEIDKYALISASDAIVLPSYGETIPLVFLEAWALKKPVVGYKIPTISSIIRFWGDGGFLVEPGDIGKLANAIHILISDSKTKNQIALRGYAKVKNHYNLESVAKRLIGVYNHLLL